MGSDFYKRVYDVVAQIPPGRITTYCAIAKYLGSPQGARMVGWALNQSVGAETYIPAHRVVNRNGLLTGERHFFGTGTMKELLIQEGILIDGNQITDMDHCFWDPCIELA